MAFYRICPDCGAYLDPGEQCSCHEERLIEMERKEKATACSVNERNGPESLSLFHRLVTGFTRWIWKSE